MRGATAGRPPATRGARLALALVASWAGAALLLALGAAPAQAFVTWAHGGIPPTPTPETCLWCHDGRPSDASCTALCHRGFRSTPDAVVAGRFPQRCWSCHEPGRDTSGLSASSSACSQGCHLYSPVVKAYTVAYSHGADPHLGAAPPYGECLDCHETSVTVSDPGRSPHHDGVDAQAPSCVRCHDGVVAGAQVSHGPADCEDCHEGMNLPAVPASCAACHAPAVFGAGDCRACHADLIHDPAPDVGTCTSCHTGYRRHAGAVACTRCHADSTRVHHGTAAPTARKCRSCHAVRHAGSNVGNARCADCHRGDAPASKPRAQHSSSITKRFVCSGCHRQRLHASAVGAATTCRSCHTGRFHAAQPKVPAARCLACHTRARAHSGGLRCVICHRSAVHAPNP